MHNNTAQTRVIIETKNLMQNFLFLHLHDIYLRYVIIISFLVKLLFWSLYLSRNFSLVLKFFVVSIWSSFS